MACSYPKLQCCVRIKCGWRFKKGRASKGRAAARPYSSGAYLCRMFRRLKERWGVNVTGLVLIICTFAIGGSISGWAARKALLLVGVERGLWWVIAYIFTVTLFWPIAVLLISIPLGQFRFFKSYLGRVARRLGVVKAAKSTDKKVQP